MPPGRHGGQEGGMTQTRIGGARPWVDRRPFSYTSLIVGVERRNAIALRSGLVGGLRQLRPEQRAELRARLGLPPRADDDPPTSTRS
jgi:hypothetical protein